MSTRPLPSQEDLHALLDYNSSTGLFLWRARGNSAFDSRYAGKPALCCNFNGYKVGVVMGTRMMQAHRVAFKYVHGFDPLEVDHINGDRSDNRIINLRDVTSTENRRNAAMPRSNTSGMLGVAYRPEKRCWRASISINNKSKHLGYFDTAEAAVAARKMAEKQYGFHANHGRRG